MNYSKEVEEKHEDLMWFMVVDVLFDTLLPLSKKKRFAETFFEDRFYAFIEGLVKVYRNGFRKLLDHLIKP